MLADIKRVRRHKDIAYNHQGPAHLSIGQEAAAVGEAFLLDVEATSSEATEATARSLPRA